MEKKILVLGTSGSGKSTLAKSLATKLNLKHIELDELFWLENWLEPNLDDFFKKVKNTLAQNQSWVVCGNYNHAPMHEMIWKKANIIIWLDYPLYKILYRVIKRTVQRITTQEKCCNNNIEKWQIFFSKKSIVLWVLKTYWRRKRRYNDLIGQNYFKEAKIFHIRNEIDLKRFLKQIV